VALEIYRKKRQFGLTPEPRGRKGARGGNLYVIQKHAARRLHYDLRLELDGVMKSWAVTRGPSLDPGEKRLAVYVEDHPVEYNTFEGTIPAGEYGGGTVMIWDRGTWIPEGDPHKGYAKGHLNFELKGEKLHGHWHLVRMRRRGNESHDNWLLIKAKDEEARGAREKDILDEKARSVATGRTMEEIGGGKGKKRVWHSNRRAGGASDPQPRSQQAFKEELRELRARSGAGKTQARAPAKSRPLAPRSRERASSERRERGGRGASEKKDPLPPRASRSPPSSASQERGRRRTSGDDPVAGKHATLPDFVPPSLATLHDTPPSGAKWIHEIKLDGYRIEARLDHGKAQLFTRNRQDWTRRFKSIADAVAGLPAKTALLDGELVAQNEKGFSSFSLLQTDLKEGRSDRLVYWVFDLLHLDGRDLMETPLTERKAALKRLLGGSNPAAPIRYCEHLDGNGAAILTRACQMELEGIVSKLSDAPYRSGRTENFIKTKCHNEQEFVVVGFSPSNAVPRAIGALTVAFFEDGELRYAGRVGTGYTHTTARDLWTRLEPLRIDKAPVPVPKDERRKNVIWVKPQTVVEAEFRGITHDGLLRQASYKGLREDKPARDVVRETPVRASSARPTTAASAMVKRQSPPAKRGGKQNVEIGSVRLSHPDRVYWDDAGVTKEDLAAYYVSVWDWMAPHVVGRPLALVRGPEGFRGELFFQKHIAANVGSSPLRHEVAAKEHDVIAVEKLDDLIALVQSGALEIHVRGSRLDALESCDRLVFDLDPGEGVTWQDIVAAARETRDRLQALKLESFVKLSGGKGIHVVVPIADVGWEAAKTFTQRIASSMAKDSPQRFLAKMMKSLRNGKIFIDYFRNSREATSVAAYSTRARAGAPVSAPLSWEQLGRTTSANELTLLNLKKHFRADPWRGLGKVRPRLPAK
jgi:bifunctional non-homologous end joining protein LigD